MATQRSTNSALSNFKKKSEEYKNAFKNAKQGKSSSSPTRSSNFGLRFTEAEARRIGAEQSRQARERARARAVARTTDSREEEWGSIKKAEQANLREAAVREAARKKYDEQQGARSKTDIRRANARMRQNGFDTAARREKIDREHYASRYMSNLRAEENAAKKRQDIANGTYKPSTKNLRAGMSASEKKENDQNARTRSVIQQAFRDSVNKTHTRKPSSTLTMKNAADIAKSKKKFTYKGR